jgi:hypothetical protein
MSLMARHSTVFLVVLAARMGARVPREPRSEARWGPTTPRVARATGVGATGRG